MRSNTTHTTRLISLICALSLATLLIACLPTLAYAESTSSVGVYVSLSPAPIPDPDPVPVNDDIKKKTPLVRTGERDTRLPLTFLTTAALTCFVLAYLKDKEVTA